MQQPEEVGDLTITYKTSSIVKPLQVSLNNVNTRDFMMFMETAKGNLFSTPISSYSPKSMVDDATNSQLTATIVDKGGVADCKGQSNVIPPYEETPIQGTAMSDLSRNEIQALLKANKAEVDAVASKMQADMAKWRELMASDIKEMKHLVVTQHEQINSRLDIQSSRIESALDSQSKKIDAALSVQEAKLEGKLSDVKLDIIKWALGLPALAFAVYKIYGLLSGVSTP